MKTETIVLKVADGTEMAVYVARPASASKAPCLLVIQEAFGVNSHMQDVARRFAAAGYLVASPELFHRSAPQGWVGDYDNFPAIMPHFQAMTPQGLEADLRATADWLTSDAQGDPSRLGSVGYCLGGRATFLVNSLLPLKAAVSYYGGRIAPDMLPLAPKQHAPILLFWGGKDGHIGPEQSRAVADSLRKAGKPFIDVEFGDADHGFFNDEKKSYHPAAARQAWALTLSFFDTHLRG